MDRTTAEEIVHYLLPYAMLLVYAALPMIYVVLFCLAVWAVMVAIGSTVETVRYLCSLCKGYEKASDEEDPNVVVVRKF